MFIFNQIVSVSCERGHQGIDRATLYIADGNKNQIKFLPQDGYCEVCGRLAFVSQQDEVFEVAATPAADNQGAQSWQSLVI